MFSMWTGQRRRVVGQAILDKVREQAKTPTPELVMSPAEYYFDAQKRILDRTQPDYAD